MRCASTRVCGGDAGLAGTPQVLRQLLALLEAYEPTCMLIMHGGSWLSNFQLL
jgi:hypothetical protein